MQWYIFKSSLYFSYLLCLCYSVFMLCLSSSDSNSLLHSCIAPSERPLCVTWIFNYLTPSALTDGLRKACDWTTNISWFLLVQYCYLRRQNCKTFLTSAIAPRLLLENIEEFLIFCFLAWWALCPWTRELIHSWTCNVHSLLVYSSDNIHVLTVFGCRLNLIYCWT